MTGVSEPVEEDDIPDVKGAGDYPLNDTERGLRFAEKYRGDFRYVASWKQWLCWDGTKWVRDRDGRVMRAAQDLARQLWLEAGEIEEIHTRTRAARAAIDAGNKAKLEAMLNLAGAQEGIAALPELFDADKFVVGLQNGVIDLRTGTFREMRREDHITKQAGAAFDSMAVCPKWTDFLNRIFENNAELIAYFQKAIGYSLSGDTSEQVLFFLYGTGRNGKSTCTETKLALFGDYAQRASTALFVKDNHNREPEADIARLMGTRFVVGSEIEEGAKLAESRVKDLTGQDTLRGRFLYGSPFEFKPTHKLWFFGNHKPDVSGNDLGIWRRMRLIPFSVQIPESEIDRELPAKLLAELSGILNWAVEGYNAWRREGLRPPNIVSSATEDYRDEEDEIGEFIADRCSEIGEISRSDLYDTYRAWAEGRGVRYPLHPKNFKKRIESRSGITKRKTRGVWLWCGLSLRQDRVHRVDFSQTGLAA